VVVVEKRGAGDDEGPRDEVNVEVGGNISGLYGENHKSEYFQYVKLLWSNVWSLLLASNFALTIPGIGLSFSGCGFGRSYRSLACVFEDDVDTNTLGQWRSLVS
jgi:hypothetical protein